MEEKKVLLCSLYLGNFDIPLALGYLKSYILSQKDILDKTEIIIESFDVNSDIEPIFKEMKKHNPDIIAFSCYFWNINKILRLSNLIKAEFPNMIIILGGPEVTYNPDYVFKNTKNIDFIISGEGEITFSELLRFILFEDNKIEGIDGIIFTKNGKAVNNRSRSPITNLDDIPSPFLSDILDIKGKKGILFEISRGCSFKCSFCLQGVNFPKKRYFSQERIKKEIDFIEGSKVNLVYILEPNFDLKNEAVRNFVNFLVKNSKETKYSVSSRAEALGKDEIRSLRRANISDIDIGLQSTNSETLMNISRTFNKKIFEEATYCLSKEGINCAIDLIIGLPGDNYEKFLDSLKFSLNQPYAEIDINDLHVLPGTPLYLDKERFKIKFNINPPYNIISNYSFSDSDINKAKEAINELSKSSKRINYPELNKWYKD